MSRNKIIVNILIFIVMFANLKTLSSVKILNRNFDWSGISQRFDFWNRTQTQVDISELTLRAANAKLISLKFRDISDGLRLAAQSSENIFKSALERYKFSSTLSRAILNFDIHKDEVQNRQLAISNYVKMTQPKWEIEETAKVLRLSQQLENILYDLGKAAELVSKSAAKD